MLNPLLIYTSLPFIYPLFKILMMTNLLIFLKFNFVHWQDYRIWLNMQIDFLFVLKPFLKMFLAIRFFLFDFWIFLVLNQFYLIK